MSRPSRPPDATRPRHRTTLLSLPPELHLLIALHLYSPLHLTQQDRLTWSVFSTVDMDPERWHGMDGLIALAGTCKTIRRTVRYLLFRCVRIHGLREGRWMIRAAATSNRDDAAQRKSGGREKRPAVVGDDWGKYVHSVILDMAMFDPDQQQVQPDEIGRRSEERGEYDSDVVSRRAIQSRVANWTTSVHTYLPDPSNGQISPFSRPGDIQALTSDRNELGDDISSGLGGTTVSNQLSGDQARTADLLDGLGNGIIAEPPAGPAVEPIDTTSGVDEHLLRMAAVRTENAREDSPKGEHEHIEGVAELEEDEEEDWESFPLTPPPVRDPWKEASFLITMLTRLPNLHHLSIFADPSDDLTLSLLFSNPAMLAIAPRLRSFGWRLRASPPSALREFDNSTMYVSVQGWLKECTALGFLVLDSDIETEGVREVDLERVVKCLGEGRERTVRRRRREARNVAKFQDYPKYQSGKEGDAKRKFAAGDEEADAVKRQKADIPADVDATSEVQHPLALQDQQLMRYRKPALTNQDRHTALTRTPSSNLSLMLCGPIQGWILTPEAEHWAAENMDDLRTWMSETKSALMMKAAREHDELPPRGRSPGAKPGRYNSARTDDATVVSELIASGPMFATTDTDRMNVPMASGAMLSPISVLSSSYSPVIPMSGVAGAGGNSYFAHHPNHTIHQEMQDMQPYIHHISNAPYQPQFSGIVPSYAHPTLPSTSPLPLTYPARPPIRSHSRSFSPLSDAERRKAALDNRPPVFLDGIVREFTGIKELFIDRPIRAPYGSEEQTLMLLTIAMIPLIHLPELTLLQIGGYPLSGPNQLIATELVVLLCPKILLCGWLGLEGETNWYGVWRDRKCKVQVQDYWGRGGVERFTYRLKALGDGDMFELEEEQQAVAVNV